MFIYNHSRNHARKAALVMNLLDWTPEKSVATEYHEKLINRHRAGASENDIRSAFRDFILKTGIAADEDEILTETRPAPDSRLKVDLYIRNTYVEFKRDVMLAGAVNPKHVAQLDEYIMENARAGNGIQNGLLTDGVNYLKRSVGDSLRPIATENSHAVFSSPAQGGRLYEYLYAIIDTRADDISPSDENLAKYFGADSGTFRAASALLLDAYANSRDKSTVAVKRKLWRDLLQVALGQDSVDDSEENDWLFVRHTYLTSLIAVIAQAYFGIDVERAARDNPAGVLNGEILRQATGLKGITESDLFTWPVEVGQTEYLRTIAARAARFDWRENPGELAATLYQNAITPDERKRMGEYYTPAWLAEAMARELIADPANTRALDPACGSGAFIAAAVRRIIAATEGEPPHERLRMLQENIVGIDLHPVAVQLAKATWVISARPVIMAARAAGGGDEIVAPIYLGDSLQLRYDNSRLIAQSYIELRTGETLDGEDGEIIFQAPLKLARQADRFDSFMLAVSDAIEKGDDARRVLDEYAIEADDRAPLEVTIARMKALHAVGRDHVWAYYLRNMTRPAVIANEKVDVIIGNPPWLAYNQSAGVIREELRALSQDLYRIWAGGRNAANQDVSTLFFCRVMDLYLKPGGMIGMVVPHSALRSGQHLKWRLGYYEAKPQPRSRQRRAVSADFAAKRPWDLKNLIPNDFFPITAGVAFARFSGGWGDVDDRRGFAKPLAPGEVEIWRGETGSADVEREIASLIHDDGEFRSPYADLARRGADVFDRRLFFVSVHPNDNMFARANTKVTHPVIRKDDKKSYGVDELRGFVVDDDNIFDVYLGESIAPYVRLSPRTAVLPASRAAMSVPLDQDGAIDRRGLTPNMRDRWEIMERLWDANKKKSDRKTLFQNLNWLNKLTSQLAALRAMPAGGVRLAYATSGRPTAAIIADDKAIVDTNLYQIICAGMDEAHYLMAIINSAALEDAVEPFRPTGLFGKGGARHLHKHLWKLPIPRYDPSHAAHAALSELGESASRAANELASSLGAGSGVAKTRRELREWQRANATARAIEGAVGELLGAGA